VKKILRFIWKWRWPLVCVSAAGLESFAAGLQFGGWAVWDTVFTFIFGFGFGIELCRVLGPEFRASLFEKRVADE
jgi:hypothetical protein